MTRTREFATIMIAFVATTLAILGHSALAGTAPFA